MLSPSPPPRLDHPSDFSRVRAALEAARFTQENISAVLARTDLKLAEAAELPILLRRTGGGTPLETLIRLFVLGVPVDKEAARSALATMPLER